MTQSVLQDWTAEISLRQQGVLVLALRGPDGLTKESGCKNIIRSLRACVMNSGREGRPMADGTVWRNDPFMRMDLVTDDVEWYNATQAFLQDIDTYNLHFFQHLIHAAAVCGLHHPHRTVRNNWWRFYERCCMKLHIHPETPAEIQHRLRDGERTEEEEQA